MTDNNSGIDDKALDSLSVAPPDPERPNPDKDASPEEAESNGQGDSNPHKKALDIGLDDSMDASDPPSAIQP